MKSLERSNSKLTTEKCWVLDSGCTHTISNQPKHKYRNYRKKKGSVGIAQDQGTTKIVGQGTLYGLPSVNHAPKLGYSLMSVRQMLVLGFLCEFQPQRCLIKDSHTSQVVAVAQMVGGLWVLPFSCTPKLPQKPRSQILLHARALLAPTGRTECTLTRAHKRLGHIGIDKLKQLIRSGKLNGIQVDKRDLKNKIRCEACIQSKAHRLPFQRESTNRSTHPLGKVSVDLFGPITPRSIGGNRYGLVLIDECTRYGWVYILRTRDEAPSTIMDWATRVETQLNKKVRVIQSDGEFTSNVFQDWARDRGTRLQMSTAYTPQSNGMAERFVKTVKTIARTNLIDSNMAKRFWPFAVKHAVYTYNRIPHSGLNKNPRAENKLLTPHERLTGKSPKYDRLRVFGSRCHAVIPSEIRVKSDAFGKRTNIGSFLGYAEDIGKKAYYVWSPKRRKVIISRDVFFDERRTLDLELSSDSESEDQDTSDETSGEDETHNRHDSFQLPFNVTHKKRVASDEVPHRPEVDVDNTIEELNLNEAPSLHVAEDDHDIENDYNIDHNDIQDNDNDHLDSDQRSHTLTDSKDEWFDEYERNHPLEITSEPESVEDLRPTVESETEDVVNETMNLPSLDEEPANRDATVEDKIGGQQEIENFIEDQTEKIKEETGIQEPMVNRTSYQNFMIRMKESIEDCKPI